MSFAIDPEALAARAARLGADDRQVLLARIEAARQADGLAGNPWTPAATRRIATLVRTLESQAAGEANEILLVDKLANAGELKATVLLRALNQKRLSLFTTALARLGGFSPAQVREALDDPARPERLALACAAIGIDKAAFPTLLAQVRELNAGQPGGGEPGARRAMDVFGQFSPAQAAGVFHQVAGQV
ncbi:MAG TPA: DUF2336 domain-containing protein [Caulobacteraceae bacterium]